ncbi:PAS domain-containing sensor histidine kinase [Sporocytophaga myxococcoides]|uniref:PAS domain-containing sensor histidine kinase n=1 Tax=Sporocytophaga myxococcoides TaxID=153721 RepID=UPI000401EE81|nr:PAS domain S-box protein [Sporocytophaga myxococcoides]
MIEEKNLNLNQEMFQILIKSSSEGILAFDTGLKFTVWNKTLEQKTGKKAEECIGKFIFDVFPHLFQEETRTKFFDTLKGKSPISQNSIFIPSDTGQKIFFDAKYFPIKNGEEIEGGLVIINDITESNSVKKHLDLLEQTIKTTFESTPYDYWLLDAEGKFLLQNNHSIQNFGDLKGKNFRDLDDSQEFLAKWKTDFEKLRKGETVTREQNYFANQDEKHFYSIITPVKQHQEVMAIVGLSIDITERIKNENIKLRNELELKTLLENSPDIIVRIDLDLKITFINRTVGKISSTPPSSFIGKTYKELGMDPKEYETFEKQVRIAIKERTPLEFENDYKSHQGIISFSIRLIPEFSSTGEVCSVLMISRETTGLEKVRNQLLENQNRLSSIMSNIPGAVFKCKNDPHWTMEFISEGVKQLTGYDVRDLINNEVLSFQKLIHPADRARVWDEVQTAIDNDGNYLVEYRIITKEGKIKWVWEQGRLVNNGGFSSSLEGVIIDITERKDFEEALKKSESELKKTNAELEAYIYKASHDLRGPLASIIGLAMVAEMEISDAHPLQYIKLIKDRTERLNDTLTNLLDLAKIKQKVLEPERIIAEELVNEIIDNLKSKVGISNIEFHINLLFKEFYYDPFILTSILHNLIENSIDFKRSGDSPQISISMSNEADGIRINIEDNGIGIPEDIMEKIFYMFYRGHDKSTGSGLGLYIVKSSVDKVGGIIDVKSELNKGSKFSIFLPCIESGQSETINPE